MSLLRPLRPFRHLLAAAVSVLAVTACNDAATAPPAVIPLDQQVWNASLQVTISQFTRLTSGVYFLDSLAGNGAVLSGTPTVAVLYSGYIPDGTKFDGTTGSSTRCFRLAELIGGWQVGMQGMRIGGTRRLLIPPDYGYGASGNGAIPGNSNLLFNVSLMGTGCTP